MHFAAVAALRGTREHDRNRTILEESTIHVIGVLLWIKALVQSCRCFWAAFNVGSGCSGNPHHYVVYIMYINTNGTGIDLITSQLRSFDYS